MISRLIASIILLSATAAYSGTPVNTPEERKLILRALADIKENLKVSNRNIGCTLILGETSGVLFLSKTDGSGWNHGSDEIGWTVENYPSTIKMETQKIQPVLYMEFLSNAIKENTESTRVWVTTNGDQSKILSIKRIQSKYKLVNQGTITQPNYQLSEVLMDELECKSTNL